jgi:hypothetical protein
MVVRPRATIDALAQRRSIRPAVLLVLLVQALGWLNLALFTLLGQDWLGTRRELTDPTYVGFFGYLPVGSEHYVWIFFLLIAPLFALLGLVVVPGLAHVLSKLWHGQGSFEAMVNTLAFAQVPSLLIQSFLNDMLLAGLPLNLLTGHPYAFTAALYGEFGPFWSTLTWTYMIAIYILGTGVWIVALGTLAIRRVQRIPTWSAALIMLFAYLVWFYGLGGTFVR